jgi:hypothetical protein
LNDTDRDMVRLAEIGVKSRLAIDEHRGKVCIPRTLSRLCRPLQRALNVLGSAGLALVCTREAAVVQFLCPLPSLLAVDHRPTSAFANREVDADVCVGVDGKRKQLRKRCATEKDIPGRHWTLSAAMSPRALARGG